MMSRDSDVPRQIAVFLACLVLLSGAADALGIHLAQPNPMTDRFIMWCPAFAAFITCKVCGVDLGTLGWRWPERRWLTLSYGVPLLYALPVYLLAWALFADSFAVDAFAQRVAGSYNLAQWPLLGAFAVGVPLLLTVGMISGLTWALGEEIGWRGFLFPRLMARFGFTGACVASGLIWAVWHYPNLLWGSYNAGTNPAVALGCFTLAVVAMAFPIGWLRLRSESVWPCALLHASHNLFVQAIFDALTADSGAVRYLTTEFGVGLGITIGITALLFWQRRGLIPGGAPASP
ncbi:CPBP family intramembrane metalloprotease [Pseudoduganella sp. FT25W]|uniref:CPBP family intramembrane metalloprotease n=1 Tax=Duganella alba TaxID=2666081 RepID=A0A6L5QKT2_9BURK|nr:CPBP family intramembrane glutamic endopeptidase [Duganella alba]MRX10068.1 CPBP family intramembrane metalloprotease [Duganella alba]MRX17737.1 CPBP family intramembrane metalloprotease [Duganella alba]